MIILIFFLAFAGTFTLYLFLITVAGFLYRRNTRLNITPQKKKNSFAIIVPAHNEERVIEKTLTTLNNMDYPTELYRIVVIADNCTDRTPLYAADAGAVVLERENKKLKGKGYALEWCFELLLKSQRSFDAFLVVDADTIVSKDILKVLNVYLNNGSKAIQCADLVKPNPGIWSSEITRVGLYLYNYAKPLGKIVFNFSAGLRGNGMCFTADLLKKIPWQAYSQTEDLEYGLILLLNRISVTFAPEAKVYAVMPSNPKNAVTQRARWELGRFPLIKKYSLLLFKEAVRRRSFIILDALIDLLTPAFVNLFLLTFIIFLLTAFLTLSGIILSKTLLIFSVSLLFIQVFYVIGGLYISQADYNAYKALLKAPKFAVWKLIVYMKLIVKGHTKSWVKTVRE